MDGQVVRNDVSFPFEDFFARAPKLFEDPVTVQVRATDTGGNITLSEPFLLTPVSDASGEGPSATNGTGGPDPTWCPTRLLRQSCRPIHPTATFVAKTSARSEWALASRWTNQR